MRVAKTGYSINYDWLGLDCKWCAVKHNSYGKWSDIIDTDDDYDYLYNRYCDDLEKNEVGKIIDNVTSIWGIRPIYEILALDEVSEECYDDCELVGKTE